jgi:hypothetical protein
MNVLLNRLSQTKLRQAKQGQHREGILLQGTIPAGGQDSAKVEVGTAGAICTLRMSGMFTTLDMTANNGNMIFDDGICHLRGQLRDTDGNLNLFNDYVPLVLFLSPGRIKSKDATNVYTASVGHDAAAPGGNLYEMQEFTHPFNVNSYILIDVKNDANYANYFAIYFDVIRVGRVTDIPAKK